MKFQVEQQKLKQAVNRMAGVVSQRNTIPILGHVKIEVQDGKCIMTATDLDISIKESFSVNTRSDGATTVSAALLKAIVDKLPNDQVTIELADDLRIKAGKSNFKLKTLPVDDFPAWGDSEYTTHFQVEADELANSIDRTIWAVSTEETRYYLNGIAMQHRDGKAVFVSTDGHRLARYISIEAPEFPSIIIPTKAAKQFKSVIEGEAVTVSISDSKIKLASGGIEIVSKVIDGTFPDWTRVIPVGNPNAITASSLEVSSAVDRVALVATERTKAVKLTVRGDEAIFSVSDSIAGDARESVEVAKDGDDCEIGLNSKYALAAMAQAEKGSVTIRYRDSMSPLIAEYEKEPNLLCVIMPMRV